MKNVKVFKDYQLLDIPDNETSVVIHSVGTDFSYSPNGNPLGKVSVEQTRIGVICLKYHNRISPDYYKSHSDEFTGKTIEFNEYGEIIQTSSEFIAIADKSLNEFVSSYQQNIDRYELTVSNLLNKNKAIETQNDALRLELGSYNTGIIKYAIKLSNFYTKVLTWVFH